MSPSQPRAPLRARIRARMGLVSPFGRRVHEAVYAQGVPRLALRRLRRSDDPGAEMLARAVLAITGRGIAPAEAAWIERIEAARGAFAERPGMISLGREPFPGQPRNSSPARIANVSSIHRPWGAFLLRLVRELRPRSCVELGTAIGISGAYQAAGLELNGGGTLRSIEGSPTLAAKARELLGELGLDERIEVVEGSLDEVLEDVLEAARPVDLAFLDAGKAYEPMLRQFRRLLPHLAPSATVVMDDIHWSREMAAGWRELSSHPRVRLAVDLRRLGACLLQPP